MRGLKRAYMFSFFPYFHVASFTDAWIETLLIVGRGGEKFVASFTDAWIETTKQQNLLDQHLVASFTDAWIETKWKAVTQTVSKSHLLQMRGLKPCRLYG